jgi:hypothetical protein
VVRGLSNYHPARDSNQEPTCIGKLIFLKIDALAQSTRFGGSFIINQLEIQKPIRPDPTRLEFEIFFSIDALAHSTRFGGSLVINQLEIRNPTRLEFEIFFFYRRLSLLDAVRGLSLIITQLKIRTVHWKNNLFF